MDSMNCGMKIYLFSRESYCHVRGINDFNSVIYQLFYDNVINNIQFNETEKIMSL